MLPCEIEDIYNIKFKRNKSYNNLNTKDRIFSDYLINERNSTKISLKKTPSTRKFFPYAQDNVGEIINYKFALNYRIEVYY